jgi:TonB family protein
MSAAIAAWVPWVQTLGWTLLHFVWQGFVIGAGFAAVRALLPKTHSGARYAAGLAALALLAAWPLATFVALRPRGMADAGAGIAAGQVALDPVAATALESALATSIDHALPWLVLLWVIGVLAMTGRALREWRALARIAREWAESNAELDAMLAALTRRFGFVRRVRVLVSRRVDTPMLIGWLRPVVLLPTAVALGFPRQQLELILAHELGHLRRYDHLVNLAQALLETLLFYHPVVHWISREVRNERELCCDELVLRQTRGEPREYARTLAALEELRQMPAALALSASGGVLLERVRRIVGMPAPRLAAESHGAGRWLMLVAVLGMALLTVLRVGRDEAAFVAPGVSMNWLTPPDARALPLAALTLPFERPRLRLAPATSPIEPVRSASTPVEGTSAAVTDTVPHNRFAAIAEERVAPPAPALGIAKPELQALAIQPPPLAAVSPAAPPAPAAPVPRAIPATIKAVAPQFPSYARREAGRVEASFTIAADGSVSDLRFAQEGAGPAFERAAERALRQWRFDPATLPADRSTRYTQTFVFAPKGGASREDCVVSTGSLICREPGDGLAKSYYRAE